MDYISNINFTVLINTATAKDYQFFNSDGSFYDITESEFKFLLYKLGPEEIAGNPIEIPGTNGLSGVVKFSFTAEQVDTLGLFEYYIVETKNEVEEYIIKGNMSVINSIPFSDTIEAYLSSELPQSIKLTTEYISQRVRYWRRFLQDGLGISNEHLDIDGAWPILANALLAKLVAYDALILAINGSLIGFLGGDYTQSTTSGGGIKSIQTGPAKVEFHPVSDSLSGLFKRDASGQSAFEQIIISLCGLANKIGIKLPMCQFRKTVYVPQFFTNPDWDYPRLDNTEPISRG